MTIRHRSITTALVLAAALTAAAAGSVQAQTFDAQQLRPPPNQQDNYFGLHSARVLPSGGWEANLLLGYANDPLVVVDASGERVGSLIGHQLTAHALFALGLFDRLELGLDLPVVLLQRGDDLPSEVGVSGEDAGVGVGDLHAMVKVSLWQSDTRRSPGGTALALVLDAQFPTGEESAFQGEGLRMEPRAVFDIVVPRSLRISLQAGYLIRPKSELLGTEVDDTLTAGIGLDLPLDDAQRWHVTGEGDLKISVLADDIEEQELPIELLFGLRYRSAGGVLVEAGGGFGVSHGFGTPDFRAVAGLGYRPPQDADGDGLVDDEDGCPDNAEDRDGFEDHDGCPDLDNDRDGVPDARDRCPNEAEDRDGFADGDGCPDPDNDQDGLLDPADRCPNEAEDTDGFADEDGCADPDNDADGVVDASDRCPIDPEDKDGFEDEDGCADPDNDRDGLLDAADECPDQPEDFDGFEDDDGCTEPGTGLVKLTCEKIAISDRVYFDSGKDTIQARSFGLLEQVANVLRSASYVQMVRVEGHTDDRGNDQYNLDLSARRAASVVRFLVERGVAAERLTSQGLGETMPIASNKTKAGRAENRRVEFMITKQDARCEGP